MELHYTNQLAVAGFAQKRCATRDQNIQVKEKEDRSKSTLSRKHRHWDKMRWEIIAAFCLFWCCNLAVIACHRVEFVSKLQISSQFKSRLITIIYFKRAKKRCRFSSADRDDVPLLWLFLLFVKLVDWSVGWWRIVIGNSERRLIAIILIVNIDLSSDFIQCSM